MHHVGFVIESIAQAAPGFVRSLQATWSGEIVHDPLQGVRVSFLQPPAGPLIELVEPAAEDSPVTAFLRRGGGLHHLCYESDALEQQLSWHRQQGDLIVRPPLPAVAFQGRRVGWICTRSQLLIEYLER